MMLRPSNAHRWLYCSLAPHFEGRVAEQPPSDEMREGTCAAWVAEVVLKGDAHSTLDLMGEYHTNGWPVTEDMVQHVQGYVNYVKSFGGIVSAEQRVRLSQFIEGTLDTSVTALNGILRVIDLKYGFKLVEVYELPQLIIYGAAEYMRLNDPTIKTVILEIYQPRAFHPEGILRTWELTVDELMQYAKWIIERGDAVNNPDAMATPGKHCVGCRAATSCAALAKSAYADHSFIQDSRQRFMTKEELAIELDTLDEIEKRLKARKEAVFAEAEQRMKQGEYIRGWYMKRRFGHRVLTVDPLTAEMITGVKVTEQVNKTPAALEREGVPVEVVQAISKTPEIPSKMDRLPKNYFNKVFK